MLKKSSSIVPCLAKAALRGRLRRSGAHCTTQSTLCLFPRCGLAGRSFDHPADYFDSVSDFQALKDYLAQQ